jgi:sulfate transport system ATP-binding protein
MSLKIESVTKRFGTVSAVREVSLTVHKGEFMALLGPSGSGKTTLLRVVGGLEMPEEGKLDFDGQDLTHVPARERRAGFVFQQYALFKHMTVAQNIAFGLNVRPLSKRLAAREVNQRVEALLARMQLEGMGKRYPSQLSGGQRQRVALARALAIEPLMLLLDEPFGALDAKVRKDLRQWLRALHDETRLTTIMVTHDQEEALALADRVAVMNEGCIEQVGPPADLIEKPATHFVRDFLGVEGEGI